MFEFLPLLTVVAVMGGVAVIGRYLEKSWISPAVVFATLWTVVSLPAGLVFAQLPGMRAGLAWIVVSVVAVLAGSQLAKPFARPTSLRVCQSQATACHVRRLRVLAALATIAGFFELLFIAARRGFRLGDVLSYAAIAQLTSANRAEFIYGDMQQAPFERFVFLLLYSGAIIGGLLFRHGRTRYERALGVLPLILLLLVFGVFGSRMGALYGGSFWVSSFLAASLIDSGENDNRSTQLLVKAGVAAGVVLFGASMGTQILRYSASGGDLQWTKMTADGVSFVGAFGIWFDQHRLVGDQLLGGGRFFRWLVALVGPNVPIAPAMPVGFTSSNIYTIHRDLIEDFGTIGALLMYGTLGFWGRWAFDRVRAGSWSWFPSLLLAYAVTFTSVAFSVFSYGVTTLAVLMLFLYFGMMRWYEADGRDSVRATIPVPGNRTADCDRGLV